MKTTLQKMLLLSLLAAPAALSAQSPTGAMMPSATDPVLALHERLRALDANYQLNGVADYERLRARQAIAQAENAPKKQRNDILVLAERRVRIAEVAANTALARREIEQLERTRHEFSLEVARQEAARARAEAERFRIEAQAQAEEAERLRQVAAEAEELIQAVGGAEAERLRAAQEREAELQRQEAELRRQSGRGQR